MRPVYWPTGRSRDGEHRGSERSAALDILMQLHDRMAVTMLLFMAAVGFWGIFTFAKGGVLGGSIAGALVIGQVLVAIQGALGVILYIKGFRPEGSVHFLYGATALIALPFIWSYAREREPRQALLYYSLAALFIAGLATRGIATGS